MKRLSAILVIILSLLSCTKDDSLTGTKWTFEFNSSPYVMEFTSDKDVRVYEADSNYNYKSSLIEGIYTYNNNKITFGENFGVARSAMIILYYRYYFKNATINNDTMKVTSSEEKIVIPIVDGEVQEPEIEYLGEKVFTLIKLSK